ncbi:MAG TPA: NAD(P)/FAD-dependent oxidoreductase [Bryobacteraceae bacterium]|nr:NAD(P)/FAD-dependent oxidoreductase [Bryobacteraceae bacterium]
MPEQHHYDVLIVGGGPAGLSCALVLGRSRRSVLVCDAGAHRNAASDAMHGYLSRDGMNPRDFLAAAREELKPYCVTYRAIEVKDAGKAEDGFRATLADGSEVRSRKLVLATGVADMLPEIEGLDRFYGKTIHHCPYCDGWEHRDQALAVYGRAKTGYLMSREMLTWSRNITLLTDGSCELTREQREELGRLNITTREDKIARLEGEGVRLAAVVFADGTRLPCDAMFFCTCEEQRCDLPQKLGCIFNRKGTVDTDRWERSNVPGVYVVGDASRDVQFVVVAAAEGAKAAQRINADLAEEDVARMLS